jgi:hypothetical protein
MNGTDVSFILPAHRLGLLRSGGVPLPGALRGKMETAFGADFSQVRIHEGAQPVRLGALAFTIGNDIHFAPGRYRPDLPQGLLLLGHELAHVVQQSQGRVTVPAGNGLTVVNDEALEREADGMGRRAAMGVPAKRCHARPLRKPLATEARAIQAFWLRENGHVGWEEDIHWRKNWYVRAGLTWPCRHFAVRVWRRLTTSPFGHPYNDNDYDEIFRPKLNQRVGGGLGLDAPKTWPQGPGPRLNALLDKFKTPDWFAYDMRGETFVYTDKPAHGNLWGGECSKLSRAFFLVAKNDFGLDMDFDGITSPFLTGDKQTIDPLATGNCNNGNNWFFQNHYWVSYNGTPYDVLFGTVGTNPKAGIKKVVSLSAIAAEDAASFKKVTALLAVTLEPEKYGCKTLDELLKEMYYQPDDGLYVLPGADFKEKENVNAIAGRLKNTYQTQDAAPQENEILRPIALAILSN